MTLRVLHLSKTSHGARFVVHQVRRLRELGIDVHVAVPAAGPLTATLDACGVETHLVTGLDETRSLGAVRSLARLLRATRPDVVHSHFAQTTMVARAARMGRRTPPILFQVPGPLHLEKLLPRALDVSTAGRRDHWGAACQWTFQRYLRSGVSSSRVHLTYYGKDLEPYARPTQRSRGQLRADLGIEAGVTVAGMVAHIYPPKRIGRSLLSLKGHEDFIHAVAALRARGEPIQGLIVGGARPGAHAFERHLHQLANRVDPDGFVFAGHRDDVIDLYGAVDIAVHPSLSENLGAAGESLLLRVPTVTTSVGGFPDVIQHEITGLMVRPRQPDELAAAIQTFVRRPGFARRTAEEGHTVVRRLADARRNAAHIAHVYEVMT